MTTHHHHDPLSEATHSARASATAGGSTQRMTKQRLAVWEQLGRIDDFRSAQQIYDDLIRSGHKVGLATVYRNIQALVDAHQVDVLRTDEGEALFRRCRTADHHHHLVCRICGHTEEISQSEIETWVDDVARSHGFTQVSHSMELFGVCGNCQKMQN
ncbi:transcriptional repressor [Schaalia sp. ZJ405]|nr:transcriptional repressor [Schaalia sp. ZJ405]